MLTVYTTVLMTGHILIQIQAVLLFIEDISKVAELRTEFRLTDLQVTFSLAVCWPVDDDHKLQRLNFKFLSNPRK